MAAVENAAKGDTRGLLVGLRERGLDVTKPILAVQDGAKALAAAVKEVFDQLGDRPVSGPQDAERA